MPTLDKIGSWTRQGAIDRLRWAIEEKHKLTEEEFLLNVDRYWLYVNGFETPLHYLWEDDVYGMLNDVYPNRFMPWEYRMAPIGIWTKEMSILAVQWTVREKRKMTREQVLKIDNDWVKDNKLSTPFRKIWNHSVRSMLNDVYPGEFKPWEFGKVPAGYWTEDTAIEAVKWTLERCELQDSDIPELDIDWVKANKLGTPFNRIWKRSFHAMINDVYPGRFNPWEFRRVPTGYWTEENAVKYLRWLVLDENKYTKEQFLEVCSLKWLRDTKLGRKSEMLYTNGVDDVVKLVFPEWANN